RARARCRTAVLRCSALHCSYGPPRSRLRRFAAPRGGAIRLGLLGKLRHAWNQRVGLPSMLADSSSLGFAPLAWTSRGGPALLICSRTADAPRPMPGILLPAL